MVRSVGFFLDLYGVERGKSIDAPRFVVVFYFFSSYLLSCLDDLIIES